jgi:hypothetical protein
LTGSFLDTTIVVHMADCTELNKKLKGEAFVKANQPADTPYYALRELLAGHIQILCETHNTIQAAENIGEALLALLKRSPAEGRKKEARVQVLSIALRDSFTSNPAGLRGDQKREMLQALALRINGLWRKSHKLNDVKLVQALGCINDGKITRGDAGELRGPSNTFNCLKSERCAAAAYLYDDKSSLIKMIDALHPSHLDPSIANKNENSQRRKALKELWDKGPSKFDKKRCRALGDAYFAAMCPVGSVVVTSNTKDHIPLCVALGKIAVEP